MALTFSTRFATIDDTEILIRGAAEAGPIWDENTVKSYLADPLCRIGLGIANWPEQGWVNRPVAMCHGFKRGTVARIETIAIDSSALADIRANAVRRRTVMDRAIRRVLEFARNQGCVTGAGTIKANPRTEAYLDSITGVSKVDIGGGLLAYEMDITPCIDFLQARSG